MLRGIQRFRFERAANSPALLDLTPLPAGPAGLCRSPEAMNAHPTAVPDLPPRDKAQSPSGEEEEGRLPSPCCPALLVASRASPRPAPWLGLCQQCRSSGLRPAVLWVPMRVFLPGGAPCAAPRKGTGWEGCFPQPSLQLTLPCLLWEEVRAGLLPHCACSSIFPAAVRLASVYKLYLSLSVCHGQMLSKEGCSLQTIPKLGYNLKQIQ